MEHQLKIEYYVVYACKDFKKARFHIQHSTFLLFYFLNLFFFYSQKHGIHAYFLGMGRVNLRGGSRVYYTHKFDMFGEPVGKLC